MSKITFAKTDLVEIIDTIMAVLKGEKEYRHHKPVVASDGNGLEIGSNLHNWKWYTEIDGCETYLDGGNPGSGKFIVENMNIHNVANFLSLSVDEFILKDKMKTKPMVCVFCKICDKPIDAARADYAFTNPRIAQEFKDYKGEGYKVDLVENFDGIWCSCKSRLN